MSDSNYDRSVGATRVAVNDTAISDIYLIKEKQNDEYMLTITLLKNIRNNRRARNLTTLYTFSTAYDA